MSAHTLAGMAAKARVVAEQGGIDDAGLNLGCELAMSIARDALRITA
jgi:hypothetical protein